jgi:hypothetical protein
MIKKYIALLVAREQPSTEMLYAVLEVVESMTPAQMSAILTTAHASCGIRTNTSAAQSFGVIRTLLKSDESVHYE